MHPAFLSRTVTCFGLIASAFKYSYHLSASIELSHVLGIIEVHVLIIRHSRVKGVGIG